MFAVIQFKPRRGARNANLIKLAALCTEALEGGARLLVLPEMCATGYRFPNPEVVRPMSEGPRGPTFKTLSPIAKQYNAWIVIGFVEDFEGKLYNAALVINGEGKIETLYRKRLLYIDDHTWASPGDLPYPVFTTPWGNATVGICMDLNDPRFLTHLRRAKPDIVCFPTNWVDEGDNPQGYWISQLKGWKGYFLAADRYGDEDGVGFCGRSCVIKEGQVLVSMEPEGDGWIAVALPEPIEAPKAGDAS